MASTLTNFFYHIVSALAQPQQPTVLQRKGSRMRVFAAAIAATFLGIPLLGASPGLTGDPDKVPVPPTPRSVERILVAQPFTVQTPFINDWSKERREFTSGSLVVLEIDGAYLVPRNATAGPVLYAGDTPVQRLNHGHLSGRVIGIVPGTVDLTAVPLWFGSPEIADAETPATALAERRKTEEASMTPLPAEQIRAARRALATAVDLAALLRTTGAELVLEYSPQEEALAEIWRLPTAKPPPIDPTERTQDADQKNGES